MDPRFETALITHCAPTLAGVKPANLFRYRSDSLEQLRRSAACWDETLKPYGIRVRVLKECPSLDAGMLYVYRESWVARLLEEEDSRAFLEGEGYVTSGVPDMLNQLSERMCINAEYPHEIGIFLGYPLEDVIGFIENRGWNYTCCGYWKAYGDPAAAQKCFDRYRKCTALYKERYARGVPLIELVVAA